ncbi:TPR domain-containing [Fusarium acutatum]|uniref:TPR domain-containing n=1 Tax=Fusarium acutatum TaxID=78861 RepID=A0A8H4NSE7_9HYPO|nr:TPR domain-containing [Fusarium acutatum]
MGINQDEMLIHMRHIADLEETISLARHAADGTPPDHPDYIESFGNLSTQMAKRFAQTQNMQHLKESIAMTQKILRIMPQTHPDFADHSHSLGRQFRDRFSQIGELSDIEEAVALMTQSVHLTPSHALIFPGRLHDLALALGDKYLYTGQVTDVQAAVATARRAVEATPRDNEGLPGRLHNLSIQLSSQYKRIGDIKDLDDSLDTIRQSIKLTPRGDRLLGQRYHSLALELRSQYDSGADIDALEESVHTAREAIKATPQDLPAAERGDRLASLASQLGAQYLRKGKIEDLEEAINIARESIKVTPDGHPTLTAKYITLSVHLRNRYTRIGSMKDLEEAIDATRKAIAVTPLDHKQRGDLLINLSIRFGLKYARTKETADFDESMSVAQQAIEGIADDHPSRAIALEVLGIRLRSKYLRTRNLDDLTESIRVSKEAIEATREPSRRAGLFFNLAVKLRSKYFHTKAMEDIEEAICACRTAVEGTPKDDPNLAKRLHGLGNKLRTKYSRTKVAADLEEAVQCFQTALHHDVAPISIRMNAGRTLLSIMDVSRGGGHDAYLVAEATIQLAPLLSPPSLQNKDKQHLLAEIAGLGSDAAAIALLAGKGPLSAIRLLETGRGVLGSSLQDLRVDISELEKKHPDLARSFVILRDQLDAPLSQGGADVEATETSTGTDRRHQAVNRMSVLLGEIRSCAEFEHFLLPPSEANLRAAAARGPIVILNVSRHRSDALIVEQAALEVVQLPQLSPKKILAQAPHVRSVETLHWLWTAVAEPVLDALGYSKAPATDSWPHIWWIPTGMLSGFPIHAAGRHFECNSSAVLDRVVSSYGSSIKTIIHSRQKRDFLTPMRGPRDVVLVAMQDTPGQKSLRHADSEILAVQGICDKMGLPWTKPKAQRSAVLSAIESCMVFHFAGHGTTDEKSPLASHLLLEDWTKDPLTVASLLDTNLNSKSPFLAYLSACGTGQVRDKKSLDESIHLTRAFQLAGFRHVIGTLWEVNDKLCVTMAQLFYGFLHKTGISDGAISHGLHYATRQLRDSWVQGLGYSENMVRDTDIVRDVVACEDMELKYPLWIPYAHYGV